MNKIAQSHYPFISHTTNKKQSFVCRTFQSLLKTVETTTEKIKLHLSNKNTSFTRPSLFRQPLWLNQQQRLLIPGNQTAKVLDIERAVIAYLDQQMQKDSATQAATIRSLVSVRINKEKDKLAEKIFNQTKTCLSEDVWQYFNQDNATINAINSHVHTTIDQIILDTPRLTQYIGVKPEKWSVVDPIFTLVTNQLFKEYASWGGSALAMKEIIAHRIYDHLAQKYQFPDSAQIKQMFAEFSGALNTDYLVRI